MSPCDVVQDFRHHIYVVLIKHPLLVLTGPQPKRRLRQRTAILVKPRRTSLWVRHVCHISRDCFHVQVHGNQARCCGGGFIICVMATDVTVINLIDSLEENKLLSPHS